MQEYPENDKIFGVINGVFYGQNERVEELNDRILDRNHSDYPLPPNFDPRPVSTKYVKFPALDVYKKPIVQIESNYDYGLETNFTPPLMSVGPVSGFLNKVDTESTLRNQFFALQKGADQGVYIPSKSSDLYRVYLPYVEGKQTHPLLFEDTQLDQTPNPNTVNEPEVGADMFNNSTRVQLRGAPVAFDTPRPPYDFR
jgi:hypothetical protein